MTELKAPFPYFGGKSKVAHAVWQRFGNVDHYIEPFFGSGAVLLKRPKPFHGSETVNDLDGFISNVWRAIAHDPDAVAHHADWSVNETDLHARHAWLVQQRQSLTDQLHGNPDYFDAKIAGWWLWGISQWIGAGWCSGNGVWRLIDGQLVKASGGDGISRQMPHISHSGDGVHRTPITTSTAFIHDMITQLSERMRRVRVCCGDWQRIVSPCVMISHYHCAGIFLDPPYSTAANRTNKVYAQDDLDVAHDVREWAIENGDDPRLRIALCGYDGEHTMPDNWSVFQWSAHGGYGNNGERGQRNKHRERIWFSPHCVTVTTQQQTAMAFA